MSTRVILSLVLSFALSFAVATPAWAGQNVLNWIDNSANEQSFDIQRTTAANEAACLTATGFSFLASVGPNVTTYTDLGLTENVTYCYRVDAANTAGASAFSNIAGRFVPFTVPNAPSGLTVTAN